MRHARIAFLLAATAGLWIACSSSKATAPPPTPPAPTLAGSWLVSINSFDTGTVSPSSFIVKVWASADSYIVSMPILTWSLGPTVFNGRPGIEKFISDSFVGFAEDLPFLGCHSIDVSGRVNTTRDTLFNATVHIVHDTANFGGSTVCVGPKGTATAVKIGSAGSQPSASPLTASGVWHVSVNNMIPGTLAPDTFTTTIGSGSGNVSATFPALSWGHPVPALKADTFALGWVGADTVEYWRAAHGAVDGSTCRSINLFGLMNTRPDTMTGSVIAVDSSTPSLMHPNGCYIVSYGSFTATK